jgi:hypothetical protein
MLIKTKIISPDSKKENQIEVEALINTAHISLVIPTAIKGQIIVIMQDGKRHQLVADYEALIGRS